MHVSSNAKIPADWVDNLPSHEIGHCEQCMEEAVYAEHASYDSVGEVLRSFRIECGYEWCLVQDDPDEQGLLLRIGSCVLCGWPLIFERERSDRRGAGDLPYTSHDSPRQVSIWGGHVNTMRLKAGRFREFETGCVKARSHLGRGDLDAAGNTMRSALESICMVLLQIHGSKTVRGSLTLEQKIDELANTGILSPTRTTWAHAVRRVGNRASHRAASVERVQVTKALDLLCSLGQVIYTERIADVSYTALHSSH
jgi:hypothetical protein